METKEVYWCVCQYNKRAHKYYMRSIIIHKFGSGGLGDFIRSGISFFAFCQENNLRYFVDFSDYPVFEKCFDLEKKIEIDKLNYKYNYAIVHKK